MEVQAVAKYIKVQPRKVRIVADLVRGKSASQTVDHLRFHPSKGAFVLRKVIMSAIANAQENHGANPDTLRIAVIKVDEGPIAKRIQARAMGRANRILKKTSHITVVVDDSAATAKQKPTGTQAKPRPKFQSPKPKKAVKAKPDAVEETLAEEGVVEDAVTEEEVEAAPAEPEVEAGPLAETEATDEPVAEAAEPEGEATAGDEPKEGE